jgi:hypothetical protein
LHFPEEKATENKTRNAIRPGEPLQVSDRLNMYHQWAPQV